MFERVPVADSPAVEPSARPPVATGPVALRPVAVQRVAAQLALRHAGVEERVRSGAAALQRAVATRQMVAREDDPPGPPDMPDVWGLSCGVKDGKPTCTMTTPKGDVDVDPETLSPQDRKAAFDQKRPKNCPPERWDWFWVKCCPPGKRFSQEKRGCVEDKREKPIGPPAPPPIEIPPAPERELGDFNLPSEYYA